MGTNPSAFLGSVVIGSPGIAVSGTPAAGSALSATSAAAAAWGTAPASGAPASPAATASTTLVMMGLGTTFTYTPSGSGRVLVVAATQAQSNTAAVPITVGLRFGTGAAPANGAAVTGTRFGSNSDFSTTSSGAGVAGTVTGSAVLTLTPGTTYWFDFTLATSNAADTAILTNPVMSIVEI